MAQLNLLRTCIAAAALMLAACVTVEPLPPHPGTGTGAGSNNPGPSAEGGHAPGATTKERVVVTPPRPGLRLALLLPLTGPAAPQAALARDGFMAAVDHLEESRRPKVTVYDTGVMSATDAVAQAHAAGTDVIVGPLLREEVAAVAALGDESTPVLALNFLPATQRAPGGLFQYALSPENEARLVAKRLLADGHHHGVLLQPRGEWGERVQSAFAREFTAGGGVIVGQQLYDAASHNMSAELRHVLRLDDSDARQRRLSTALGLHLNFEPRRRSDAEFLFIIPANSVATRLIEAQLRYLSASDLPVYSISNAYDGGSAGNRELEGVRFPEMPWMLTGDGNVDDIRAEVQRNPGTRSNWHSRLFAFGYDACGLAINMSQVRNPADARLTGLTGQMRFDADHRIFRDLQWVKVDHDGQLQPLASVE